MRRPTRRESLHGTRHGQIEVDAALAESYALTDRESATAALLAEGLALTPIAERLQITKSTAEKHLASLRQKMGARTTAEAVSLIARFSSTQQRTPRWPVTPLPHERSSPSNPDELFVSRLDEAVSVDSAVAALCEHLAVEGVGALCFVYLPMMVASFRRGDIVESWCAPAGLIEAHRDTGGFAANRVAQQIFAEPDRVILVDANDPASVSEAGVSEAMLGASSTEGFSLCVSFAGPFGCGFVGTSMFFRDDQRESLRNDLLARSESLRNALMLTLGSVYSRGVLARSADLTVRERDALRLIAEGMSIDDAAEQLGSRPRTVSQLLKGARRKLGADTNAAAVARAMSLNALTFL